jgi:phosphoglycerate-specific signal transduction histidine kinase
MDQSYSEKVTPLFRLFSSSIIIGPHAWLIIFGDQIKSGSGSKMLLLFLSTIALYCIVEHFFIRKIADRLGKYSILILVLSIGLIVIEGFIIQNFL